MLALLKRNFLLYFRNRSGVFFSLLGALISFVLYIIFLQKNLTDAWAQLPNSGPVLNNWLMSGTLAVTGITTSLAALTQLVKDREHQVDQDLYLDSLGKFSTIVGTASGFLVGTYVPLGVLPDFAQLLMKCTPATYIAALYRQVLMKETLSETFKGQDNLLQEFREKMGVQLKWQGLLTKENTYLIVLGGILLASILWIVLVKRTSQKK